MVIFLRFDWWLGIYMCVRNVSVNFYDFSTPRSLLNTDIKEVFTSSRFLNHIRSKWSNILIILVLKNFLVCVQFTRMLKNVY